MTQRPWHGSLAHNVLAEDLEEGALIAHDHGVWRYDGRQDRGGGEEYAVFSHEAGYCSPENVNRQGRKGVRILLRQQRDRWTQRARVNEYPRGRWPQCSCCGEPMPCRADITDLAVAAATIHSEKLETRLPGACWSCGELITRRQWAVRYPGVNLDHPLRHTPEFHARRSCLSDAVQYENRWRAADERRPRLVTWPECDGVLTTHHDQTLTCHSCDVYNAEHGRASICYGACDRGCADVSERWGCASRPTLRRDVAAAIAVAEALDMETPPS